MKTILIVVSGIFAVLSALIGVCVFIPTNPIMAIPFATLTMAFGAVAILALGRQEKEVA